jgi:hypothetical protein
MSEIKGDIKVKKFKKVIRISFVCVLLFTVVFAIGWGVYELVVFSNSPTKLEPGWNLVQLNGRVPAGTIIVFSDKSELIVVKEGDSNVSSTPLRSGRATVVYAQRIISSKPVWVYSLPEGKGTIKINSFSDECLQKWETLNGGDISNYNEYLIK